MNVELVAQMFKNYQSNVLFHLEGNFGVYLSHRVCAYIFQLRKISRILHNDFDVTDGKGCGVLMQ